MHYINGIFPAAATSSILSSPQHFADFCRQYDEKYAATYGMYRLERIQRIGERFSTCGDPPISPSTSRRNDCS